MEIPPSEDTENVWKYRVIILKKLATRVFENWRVGLNFETSKAVLHEIILNSNYSGVVYKAR